MTTSRIRAWYQNPKKHNSAQSSNSPWTRTGTVVTWVFNTFGTADLLFAFYQGSRISLPNTQGLLGAGYFILTAYVPLLLITHGLTFRILLRTNVVVPSPSKVRIA